VVDDGVLVPQLVVLDLDILVEAVGVACRAARVAQIVNYLSVKNVSSTFPFSPIKHRNVRRVSFLPFSR